MGASDDGCNRAFSTVVRFSALETRFRVPACPTMRSSAAIWPPVPEEGQPLGRLHRTGLKLLDPDPA